MSVFRQIIRDPWAGVSLAVIGAYAAIAVASALGWIAAEWNTPIGERNQPPTLELSALFWGTDFLGRSVLYKMIQGVRIAMGVGVISTLLSIPLGLVIGVLAGFYPRWGNRLGLWAMNTVSSVPQVMLMIAIAMMLGKGFSAVSFALAATTWVPLARVIRGEVIRHREMEYVLAAQALGVGPLGRMFRHVVPNLMHLVIIHFSIQFILAIKSEVILSYLGVGIRGTPSWGIMIDDARVELLRGQWWQLSAATVAMMCLVLAFNVLGDALRDAFDPKIK